MKVTWLHLTDLHRGMTAQHWMWPNVEENFFEDLALLHKHHGPIDLILFSGDFVQKGAASEYDKLTRTLERLYARLKDLGSAPFLLGVPGNHDLVRPKPTKPEVRLLTEWGTRTDIHEEFWTKNRCSYRKLIDRAFKNYTNWWKKHPFPRLPQKDGILPGDFATEYENGGVRIGIIGLNSTFLQLTRENFETKLVLHPTQLSGLCGEEYADWFKQKHFSLLMTHQPPDWLTPESRAHLDGEIAPPGRFAVHFFGHMHETQMSKLSLGGAAERRYLQGRSLFGLDTWELKQQRKHGFSLGTLTIRSGAREAELRVWPRRAAKHQAGHLQLVRDTSFTLQEDGGTRPEPVSLHRASSSASEFGRSGRDDAEDSRFHILLLATDTDLADTRHSVVQYLNTALGVHAIGGSASNRLNASQFDLVILLQGWWWDGGGAAKLWATIPQKKRAGFMVDPNANWPPRKLIQRGTEHEIELFLAQSRGWKSYSDPAQLPELVGEVVSAYIAKVELSSGSSRALGLKSWERTYLSYRIPSWISGRTAGRPHILEPENATELYRPELYVPLNGTSSRWQWRSNQSRLELIETASRDLASEDIESSAPLAKWVSAPELSRAALVGAPGGGKTVFLTRIAAAFAHAGLGRPREIEPHLNLTNLRSITGTMPIPLVLEATRLEKQKGHGKEMLLSAIREEFAQAGNPPTTDEVNEGLSEYRYILFVDALDEISDSSRRLAVLDLLKAVASSDCYPDLRIVVTTRSARYTGTLAFGPEFELVDVDPLGSKQTELFCRNWSTVRKRDSLYLTDLMLAVTGLAVQVEKEGKDEAMTSNPLMLTAICMVFERYQSLPDDRARLCSLLVDDLCRSRNSEDLEHSWRLSDANKRDLLERIALPMQEEGSQAWAISKAIEIAMRGVPTTEQFRQQRATKHLHWAAEHTGLLRFQQPEKGEEEIRFWHRLFREFLAASRLSQQDVTVSGLVDQLSSAGYLTNPFWEDVIRLLPRALGTLEKAKSLREQLEKLANDDPVKRGRLLGLLAAGIIESRDLFPDVDVTALSEKFATLVETEGFTWPIRDRLLFLEGLGGLDSTNGDPRIKIERWFTIPSGSISDRQSPKRRAFRVEVKEFAISWAPVTVQEFRSFIEDKDCFNDEYWRDAVPTNRRTAESLSGLGWRKQLRHLNYPVTSVTYWDALAYCRWRTAKRKDGRIVRPLTREQLLRTAFVAGITESSLARLLRHTGESAIANLPNLGLGHCSPVGTFPAIGKVEAVDLIGNVLEWSFTSGSPSIKTGGGEETISHIDVSSWKGSFRDIFSSGMSLEGQAFASAKSEIEFIGFRCALIPPLEGLKPSLTKRSAGNAKSRGSKSSRVNS